MMQTKLLAVFGLTLGVTFTLPADAWRQETALQ